jgi:hypothetical protein
MNHTRKNTKTALVGQQNTRNSFGDKENNFDLLFAAAAAI